MTTEIIEKRIKLSDLHGILSKKAGDHLEKSILEGRKLHRKMHEAKIKEVLKT